MTVNEAAAALIEAVLKGEVLDRKAFNSKAASIGLTPNTLPSLEVHQAGHYLDDLDLRRRDAAYEEAQQRTLRGAVQRLRSI